MKIKQLFQTKQFKNGSYSLGLIVAAAAILIVINLIAAQLPSQMKHIDLSDQKLYTIGDATKELVSVLDQEVLISIIAEPNAIDGRIKQLVENYGALSKQIKTEIVDPILHPSILTEYETTENSIVVSCPASGKKTSIAFDEIIAYDQMAALYYGYKQETEFDGEGQITSAIDYVTGDVQKKIYTLEGHGEQTLPSSVTDLMEKSNFGLESVNLLTSGSVPEDCDLLLLYAPDRDLADDEKELLSTYLNNGGRFYILLGPKDQKLPNIEAIMMEYGMQLADGYIADSERYYQSNFYNIFPKFNREHEISSADLEDDLILVSAARGMLETTPARDTIETTPFILTSEAAYAVTENGQQENTYWLGATAVETTENGQSKLVVLTAGSLIDEAITKSFSNLLNLQLFMHTITWNFDDVSDISIPAKSLQMTYNTIVTGSFWSTIFIFILPASILITGFLIWMKRRRA